MNNRRDFLRASLIGCALTAIGPWAIPAAANTAKNDTTASSDQEPLWSRTIFCQFNHPALKKAIDDYARAAGCLIACGEPYSSDVLKVEGFVYVLDRTTFKPRLWKHYARCWRAFHVNTPCIFIDSKDGIAYPRGCLWIDVNMPAPGSIDCVLENVIKFHEGVELRKMFSKRLKGNFSACKSSI